MLVPLACPRERRLPSVPMPAYRYVPGLQPHPFRHEAGHGHLVGQEWPAPLWCADGGWESQGPWLHGLDLFDHRFFWESHECWEQLWLAIDRDHIDRQLVQGMIQAAAFVIKQHTGRARAAENLLARSLARLAAVRSARGDQVAGVHLPSFMSGLVAFRQGAAWPCVPMAR